VEHPRLDVVLLPERLRRADDQVLPRADQTADVVGNASSRVGREAALLEGDNPEVRSPASRLGGRGHARCVSPDDHQPLSRHVRSSLLSLPVCETQAAPRREAETPRPFPSATKVAAENGMKRATRETP
jgi:hypothetical protein